MRIRQSEFTSFTDCRRKHHFAYTRGIVPVAIGPRQPASGQRDAGTLFHAGVEAVNRGSSDEEIGRAVREKCNEMRAIRNPDPLPPLDEINDPEWYKVFRLAAAMVDNYEEWLQEGNEIGVTFDWIEQEWESEIPNTQHSVYGMIDAVLYDPDYDGMVVRDYKTVATFNQTPQEVDFQLRTYAWGYWRTTGTVPRRAEHLMAKRVLGTAGAKRPFFERYGIPINEGILLVHEQHLAARARDMNRAFGESDTIRMFNDVRSPALYPNPGPDCAWKCDYKDICPMVDDGSDLESMIDFNFALKESDE